MKHKNFIDNQWVDAQGGETLAVIDPSDGASYAEIARSGPADIDAAVRAARQAYEGAWGKMAPAERSRLLLRFSLALQAQQNVLADIESRDTGKPIKQALADAAAIAR